MSFTVMSQKSKRNTAQGWKPMNKNTQMIGNMNEEKNVREYLRKKAMPKHLYVVAPTRQIFLDWCALRGIHWNNPSVTWINRHELVLGRTIFHHDEVAFVARDQFEQVELSRIDAEINIRTRIE